MGSGRDAPARWRGSVSRDEQPRPGRGQGPDGTRLPAAARASGSRAPRPRRHPMEDVGDAERGPACGACARRGYRRRLQDAARLLAAKDRRIAAGGSHQVAHATTLTSRHESYPAGGTLYRRAAFAMTFAIKRTGCVRRPRVSHAKRCFVPVRPLDDIRVLDLTHFYNGPYGTLLLSYLGADVIKIEPPGHGEGMRALYRAPGREISIGFAILNVNKRSVTLNLKSDEGREIFKRMVARADVVAENFAYGAMEGFGLGYEVLRAINPRIIYATGKGYGLSGPYRDLPAFDPVVQAMSGVLTTTGEADGPPMKAGPAVVDMLGGVHFAAAILA